MSVWQGFEGALAEELGKLPPGAVVVIDEGTGGKAGRYVQFRVYDDHVHAELGTDEGLDAERRAGAAGQRTIRAAGWSAPDRGKFGCPNWHTAMPWPSAAMEYRRLAAMVVAGLRDAYRMESPAGMVYRAWDEESGSKPLELLRLGLKREN